MRTLSAESSNPFVVHDKEVDIVRFAINSGFADIVLDGQVALRVMYQRPGETEVRAQTLTYYNTDGLHNYYDWQLSQSDLTKDGSLMVALCILDISGGEVSEWHTTPCAVQVLSTIHTDDSDEADDTITPTVKERVAVLESMIQRVASGAPIVVSSVSAMTDADKIYVLTTDNRWYYHNGSAWVAGGEYGAVSTDTTLTQSGVAADAKVVGDKIDGASIKLSDVETILDDNIGISYTNDETFSKAGSYYFTFDPIIPKGTTVYIRNNASSGNFSVNMIDGDGNSTHYSDGIAAQSVIKITLASDAYSMRAYVSAAGNFQFTIIPIIDNKFSSVIESLSNDNLFVHGAFYVAENTAGSVVSGVDVLPDWSIKVVKNLGTHGQVLLKNPMMDIMPGTYRVSATCTVDASAPVGSKVVCLRLGDNSVVDRTITTTEDVLSDDVSADFNIATQQEMILELIPKGSTWVSSGMPVIFTNVTVRRIDYIPDSAAVLSITDTDNIKKSIYNSHRFFYISDSTDLSFESVSGGGLKIHVGGLLNMRLQSPYNNTALAWTDIVGDDIASRVVIDGNAIDITLPTFSEILIFNIDDGKLHIRNARDANLRYLNDIILVQNAYASPSGGKLYEIYNARLAKSAGDKLGAVDIFNGEPYTGVYDWRTPMTTYGALFKNKNTVESFAFFTDPHVLGFGDTSRNEVKLSNYLKRVQTVYRNSPCDFIISGGDWLNNATTMDEACYRLGRLKGISDHLLDGCYLVKGNHDTNYQGKKDAESDNYTGRLTDETIASILYRDTDTKKAYYSFSAPNCKCYVLDTGIEHSSMNAYDWEQVDWLAGKLLNDDPKHAIMFLHILVSSGTIQNNALNFGAVVEAYNNRTKITLNNKTYDFGPCTGHVDFWAAGHTHIDSTGTLGGIPYFITATNSYNSDVPIIDLVLVDYDDQIINLVRVGSGENRTIALAAIS